MIKSVPLKAAYDYVMSLVHSNNYPAIVVTAVLLFSLIQSDQHNDALVNNINNVVVAIEKINIALSNHSDTLERLNQKLIMQERRIDMQQQQIFTLMSQQPPAPNLGGLSLFPYKK